MTFLLLYLLGLKCLFHSKVSVLNISFRRPNWFSLCIASFLEWTTANDRVLLKLLKTVFYSVFLFYFISLKYAGVAVHMKVCSAVKVWKMSPLVHCGLQCYFLVQFMAYPLIVYTFIFSVGFYFRFSGFAHLLVILLINLFLLQLPGLLQKLRFKLASSLMIANAVLILQCIRS